jgi:hypothetical protein
MRISKGSSASKVPRELLGRRFALKEIHKFNKVMRNPDVRRRIYEVMKLIIRDLRSLPRLGGGAEALGATPDWL